METTKDIKNEVSNGARYAANQATKKASQLSSQAASGLEEFRNEAADRYEDIEARAKELARTSYDVVKTYPVYSILGAAAIGFIAGSVLNMGRKH